MENRMDTSRGWHGEVDPLEDLGEKKHIGSVLDSFRQYRQAAHLNVTHSRRRQFFALPQAHWQLLSRPPFSVLERLSRVDDAIDTNACIAEAILDSALYSLDFERDEMEREDGGAPSWHNTCSKLDLDKARSTVHQLYRDWSKEGSAERDECFAPIFNDLQTLYADPLGVSRSQMEILVPGAGLGRLMLELCKAGYNAEGNEISYHQLFTSELILNKTVTAEIWQLFPWAFTFSNNLSIEDQLRSVYIPDIVPKEYMKGASGSMKMSAGDFCETYVAEEYQDIFDAVVTLFFIDTAPNLITYINVVKHCLKPGGVWINVGPLLWHFSNEQSAEARGPSTDSAAPPSDSATEQEPPGKSALGEHGSVELNETEVLELVKYYGFHLELSEPGSIRTGYIQNPRSMLQHTYRASHWVVRKP